MSDPLAAGLVLGVVAAGAAAAGPRWLAVAALAAAAPFLAVGISLALGEARARRDQAAGSAR